MQLEEIRLVLLDVDGVLTDGRLGLSASGDEIKFFSTRDGYTIRRAVESGIEVGFISGRMSSAVDRRARELGVEIVVQGSADKLKDFRLILSEAGIAPNQVAFMGDDIPDLVLMSQVGLPAAPADAAPEVRAAAEFVSAAPGGRGAVRELLELVLKAQNLWFRQSRRRE